VHENLYQWIALRHTPNKGWFKRPSGFEDWENGGRPHGADVTWTLMDHSASLQHFLVGDAAAVLDPSSSHGILRALFSGILAAQCIAQIFANQTKHGAAAVAGYKEWQRNWFLHDVRQMRRSRTQPRSTSYRLTARP
jgi:hypothetical protein